MNTKTTIKPKKCQLKPDGTAVIRIRNVYGEVTAYVIQRNGSPLLIDAAVGLAFCNPRDFSLPKDIRRMKGVGLARARAVKRQLMSVPGSTVFKIARPSSAIDAYAAVVKVVVRILSAGEFRYFTTYHHQNKEGEFVCWYVPFLNKLREDWGELLQ